LPALLGACGLVLGVVGCGGGTATPRASASAADAPRTFDLEAHRGGAGLTVESTLAAFGHALDLGVTTLELDTQITRDGRAVVTHDAAVDGRKCRDTAPATPGDPAYPYVGKHVNTLRLAQVRTLDCGSRTLPSFPGQKASPGARMPLLSEVFALARSRSADSVRFNIETKISADAPSETASASQFVRVLAADIKAAGVGDRVSIESFDWGSLVLMKKVSPDLPLVALTDRKNLEVGRPGASPWLGGIDIDDFGGDVVKAASSFGAEAVSPVHGSPSSSTVDDPSYRPYVTAAMVRSAHRLGIKVIPWTVDDEPTMRAMVADGVDGLITNYPDRLRRVLQERGLPLPTRYAAR
jgi:glycerophosphoryl diester phosphodiesterase